LLSSGAAFTIYASPYSVEYGDYVFGTNLSEDRFNDTADEPLPDDVDIIMTHGPPKTIRDTCIQMGVSLNSDVPLFSRRPAESNLSYTALVTFTKDMVLLR
jgi:hypothetical protein